MRTSRQQPTFLVVDDEPDILDAIQRLFRKDYRVLTARTAAEALDLVEQEDVQVVMSDQRMPRMSGIEFLAQLRQTHPEIVRVLFTGYSNIDHVIDAINEGHVYRYISKPWKPSELKLFVAQAFEHYESKRERQELLERLTQANERLEEQNAMLSAANEELKILDRMKNVFMEVVSHELNTPIAIILGYVFLLRKELDGKFGKVTDKALGGIDSSAMRLKRISNRIFKMLSDEGPASTVTLERMHVEEFIAEVQEQVDPFLVKREQTLAVSVAPQVDTIEADREKLTDIFLNLIMNAIKFSHDGQTIHLKIEPAEPDNSMVAFCVEDEGIGISKEDLAQIFNAFFSTFESRHHSSGDFEFGKRGIGLGLSVAKRFAEMHGGRIEVESTEGQGSRFTVLLPREPHAVDGLREQSAIEEASAAS